MNGSAVAPPNFRSPVSIRFRVAAARAFRRVKMLWLSIVAEREELTGMTSWSYLSV